MALNYEDAEYRFVVIVNGIQYKYMPETNKWVNQNNISDIKVEIIAPRVKFIPNSHLSNAFEDDILAKIIKIEEVD